MADYKVVDIEKLEAGLTATANAIREKTGGSEKILWNELNGMASSIDEVFEEGKTEGYAEGIQSEYDRFWDAYQNKGMPGDFPFAFSYSRWNSETFTPKYDIVISERGSASGMFQLTGIVDVSEALEKSGVILDTSKATTLSNMYHGCNCIRVPGMDASNAANLIEAFSYSGRLKTIDKIVSNENLTFTNAFLNSLALANIAFEGAIGQDINFQWSPLSAASINSVITHLSGTTTGKTATFKLSAVNTAFETTAGAADGSTSQAWLDLIATKTNWTISLV